MRNIGLISAKMGGGNGEFGKSINFFYKFAYAKG